uniref:Uncharacterized protein n=1 Tax=Rhipicephalus zambeziensis TaxID=60191 RepID=A0A224Y674_9ACAR
MVFRTRKPRLLLLFITLLHIHLFLLSLKLYTYSHILYKVLLLLNMTIQHSINTKSRLFITFNKFTCKKIFCDILRSFHKQTFITAAERH